MADGSRDSFMPCTVSPRIPKATSTRLRLTAVSAYRNSFTKGWARSRQKSRACCGRKSKGVDLFENLGRLCSVGLQADGEDERTHARLKAGATRFHKQERLMKRNLSTCLAFVGMVIALGIGSSLL